MKNICIRLLVLFSLSQSCFSAPMPVPGSQWRIAGLNFGVRHLISSDSLCTDNQIHTYAMANIDQAILPGLYNSVFQRIRLICQIPPTRQLTIPVDYQVADSLVASFVLVSDSEQWPSLSLRNLNRISSPTGGSALFQSYWDSYGSPEFRLPRNPQEAMPAWAQADYLYALAVDRKMLKVGTYDVYFDSRFDAGALTIADEDAFEQAIEAAHPLALIMSMLDVMPYIGMSDYNIEGFWRNSLAQLKDTDLLKSQVSQLVNTGFLQADIFASFLQRMGSGSGGDGGATLSVLPEVELNNDTATSAIQDYFRATDCDSFPRVFFNDPDNDSARKIALAASLYSFAGGGCASGIRSAELIITLSSSVIEDCSSQGSGYQCSLTAQYQCDGNNFLRGTAQTKLACSAYVNYMVDARSLWGFEYDSSARKWIARFLGK